MSRPLKTKGSRIARMRRRITVGTFAGVSVAWIINPPQAVRAALITPVSDFASTYYSASQSPTNLINNSGLNTSSGNVLTYTHAADGSANGMWHVGQGQGSGGSAPAVANQYVVFDLGGIYDLSSAYFWQMIQPGNLGRGIKDFELYASSSAPYMTTPPSTYNLAGYTSILGASTLAQASGTSTATQAFSLSGANNVRTVYLKINSAWSGTTNDYVGLSEIKFEGMPVAPPPPSVPTVTPKLAYASTYYAAQQSPTNLINDSGLDTGSGDVLTYTHAPDSSANNMWHAGQGQGDAGAAPGVDDQYVMFDLGGNYDLSKSYLWQMVQSGSLGRGVKEFRLLGSPDAALAEDVLNPPAAADLTGFTEILSTSTLAQGPASGNAPTQAFDLTAAGNIRRVYLQIISDYNSLTNDYVGLAEAKFGGTLIDPASVTWSNPASGSWETDGNWSNAIAPTPNTAVTFSAGGTYAATLSSDQTITDLAFTGGAATLNVDGARLIANSVQLNQGTLNIENGAIVQSIGNILTTQGGGGPSAITVDGLGSWLVSTRGSLLIGNNGLNGASLKVLNGGKADAYSNVFIGNFFSNASVEVAGAGSILTSLTHAEARVGFSNGTGSLTIRDGGVVTLGTTRIGYTGTGTVTVDGAGSKLLTPAGAILVGQVFGNGQLTIINGGLVENWTSDTEVGGLTSNAGNGTLTVGKPDGTDTGGSLLRTRLIHLRAESGSPGVVNINPGGTVELRDGLYVARHADSVVNLQGGTLKTPYLYLSAADLNFTSGTLWLTGPSGFTPVVTGTISVPAAGLLKGNGSLGGAVSILGTISPGDGTSTATISTHTLTIGNLTDRGVFAADIDLAGISADLLSITGSVNLANAGLDLALLNIPPTLVSPRTYLLIANDGADAVSGTFASVNLTVFANVLYSIDYSFNGAALNGVGTGNDVAITFTAVPEPASLSLIALGGLALLRRRRA